jgi:hypothetical protein
MFKDLFSHLYSDIFSPRSTIGTRLLASLISLLMLLMVGVLGVLIFIVINTACISPTRTIGATIEKKDIIPAYTTTTMILAGKVIVPSTVYHPESYNIHFKIDRSEVSMNVSKTFFKTIAIGDKIEVDYGFGRLNNSYEPVNIRLANDR